MNEKKWHCLYTKPGRERKVSDQLKRKGITAYIPLTLQRSSTNNKRSVAVPLFKSFVFVRIDETDKGIVLRTDGVQNFVYWLGNPVNLRDSEIQVMRMFIAEHSKVQVIQTKVNPHDMVRIITDHSSEVSANGGFAFTNPVKIIIPAMGYAIVAESAVSKVETLNVTTRLAVNQDWQMASS